MRKFRIRIGIKIRVVRMTILPVSDFLLTVEMTATYKRMIADKAAAAAVTLRELCSYAEFL